MNTIIFDAMQWEKAEKQLHTLEEELERIGKSLQEAKRKLAVHSIQYQYQEEFRILDQSCEEVRQEIHELSKKMIKISNCYQNVEQKNIQAVEKLSERKMFSGNAVYQDITGQSCYKGEKVRVRETLNSSIQYENWVIRALG